MKAQLFSIMALNLYFNGYFILIVVPSIPLSPYYEFSPWNIARRRLYLDLFET